MRSLTSAPKIRQLYCPSWCYWDNCFTDDELQSIKQMENTLDFSSGNVLGKEKPYKDLKQRKCSIAFILCKDETSWIFKKVFDVVQQINERFYEFNLNGFPAFQYTLYRKGGDKYDWHTDGSAVGNTPDSELRKLSLSIMLSDPNEYTGGKFEIWVSGDKGETIPTPKGRIILFPSYILHRVTPILTGTRKSLVAWVVGPKFI